MSNPTIVIANLDDNQLKASIQGMVDNFNKQLNNMVNTADAKVREINEKLRGIKYDVGSSTSGSADVDTSKQAKAQNDATEAAERRIKKERELKLTLDEQYTAIRRATSGALEVRTPDMAKSARESFQAFYKGFNEQARKLDSLVKAEENRLSSLGLGRFSQETRNQLAQMDVSIDQSRFKINLLYQEEKRLHAEALKQKVSSTEFDKLWTQKYTTRDERVKEGERLIQLEKERQQIIASDPSVRNLDAQIEQTRTKIRQLYEEEKRLQEQVLKMNVNSSEAANMWNRKYEVRDERIAQAEKLVSLEKERQQLVSVDPIRTQLTNMDELRAKHEKVLGVMRDETTTNNKVAQSQQEVSQATQQTAQATQQNTQSAKQYTEEIRKQAQAIRESKQWQEKGYVAIDGGVLSNQENVAKSKRISLEEQILHLQQQGVYVQQDQTSKEWQLVDASGKRVAFIQQENENLQAQQARISEIARETRELFKKGSFGKISFTPTPLEGTRYIYQENDARANGLTIEQQIENILKEQAAEYEKQNASLKNRNQQSEQQLNTEKQITQEVEKQKKEYIAPSIYKSSVTQSMLRPFVEEKLGLGFGDAITSDATSNIKTINAEIKQLNETWQKMSDWERKSPFGDTLRKRMQMLQRQSQQLNAQLSRPVSLKDALSGSEKTLDDIANKIRRLQSYMQGLDTSNEKSAAEFQRAAMSANLLKEKQNQLLQKNSQLIRSNGELFASNTALGRSWNYMKNRLAFYFTVGASTQFVKQLVEIRSQYEMNERALGILINSAERGTQIFNELSQMALVSPYTLIELSSAAKQLVAYDVAAKDVVDTTRRLADMASAVGVPMERLTYALGQIKAYGYLNARDARMFANAGIPLVKELSDYYTKLEGRLVSTADIYDRIKKKAIGYNDVMSVVNHMTDEGGRFFDFQEKMAGTLKVQLANLTLAWNNMLNDIGASQQGILSGGIGALKELFLAWKDLSNALVAVASAIGVAKAAQLLINHAIGTSTVKTLEYVAANEAATWVEYKRALSIRGLNAMQAKWLVLTNQSNKALLAAILRMGLLDKATFKNIASLNSLQKGITIFLSGIGMGISGLIKGVKALGVAFVKNLPLLALFAIVDAWQHLSQVAENNEELNKSIANGAKEAAKALDEFLKADDKVTARLSAQQKKLNQAEGEKTWEAIREQIELSAMSAKSIIPELVHIPDINERITASFNLAERIKEAAEALSGIEDELKVSQDSILYGSFGEGLDEDIEDYVERIKAIKDAPLFKDASWWQRLTQNTKEHQQGYLVGDLAEAKKEITQFANDAADVIRERLGEEGMKDNIKVGEAVERLIKETEAKFPKIRGVGKKLFEAIVSDTMGTQFPGVYNSQEQYYKMFLEQLGKDYSSKFDDITDTILKGTHRWNTAQLDAIKKTAEKIKKDLPEASKSAIDKIQEQLDTKEFKLRIITEFAKDSLNEEQKAFEKRFYDVPLDVPVTLDTEDTKDKGFKLHKWGDDYKDAFKNEDELTQKERVRERMRQQNIQKYHFFMKKTGEDNVEYEKRISEEKEKQKKIAKETQEIIDKGGNEKVAENAKAENKAAKEWLAHAKEVEEWGGFNFTKDKKGNKKDPLLDALKLEAQLVEKLQGDYDKLTKSGANQSEALATVRMAYGKTIKQLNAQLGNYGLPQLDIAKLITGKDPHAALEHFKKTLQTLVDKGMLTLERSKELEAVMEKLTINVKKYDLDMITKGLNNELGKLKDEYELAVAIDADPELGNAFADMMGINVESLPHTVKEYADRYSTYLNKYLKGKDSSLQFTGDELRGLTRDDITAFREQVDAGSFNQEWFDAILKAYEDISGKRKKDLEETEKWKNSLIEKYGNLQDKLTKIYKDSVQNQVNAVKTFGTEDQKSDIVRLQLRLEATDNPAELAEINTEIAKIVKDVTDKNPIALKLVTASGNQTKADTSKAYWENFKKDDLYTMTFEDMANNSTRAIQLIINKLNGLKDKVKEDPASMKALMKSLEDAEKELNTRDPFGGVARSLKAMSEAATETKLAQEAVWRAEVDVEDAQKKVDESENLSPEEQKAAQDELAAAIKRRAQAQTKLTQVENKGKKAQENLKSSLQGISNQLGDVKELFGVVSKLFRAGGDDETADAIDAISEGFSIMTTVIMGVVAAMALLEAGHPWLLAIAAALSVIVGLVSFLSGQKNKSIDKKIKESELAVSRLELAYKNLEVAIENAYGANVIGAKQAAIANKELQLAELKRQLALEKSRDSKDRDEGRIVELQGQIIDLQNDIKRSMQEIATELLGISSVGDAALSFMDAYISALRKGEDAQAAFTGSWKEMIANMLKQIWVTKVIGPQLGALVDEMNKRIENRSKTESDAYEKAVDEQTRMSTMSDGEIRSKLAQQKYQEEIQEAYYAWRDAQKEWNYNYNDREGHKKVTQLWGEYQKMIQGIGLITQEEVDNYKQNAKENERKAKEALDKATMPTIGDLDLVAQEGLDLLPRLESMDETFKYMLDRYGLYDKESNLSALQQGIQGVSEETASAVEAYLNGMSQQAYLRNDLLTQINTTLQGFDLEVQTAAMGQILLQLQSSYQVQMSIRDTLQGWSNASGMAMRVEMI